jgi:hypothetical protein
LGAVATFAFTAAKNTRGVAAYFACIRLLCLVAIYCRYPNFMPIVNKPSPHVAPFTVGLIPLDARPVCYQWPQQLAALAGWQLVCPPATVLTTAGLKHPVPFEQLWAWWQSQLPLAEHWVWSVDMVAYGGLIPSRVGSSPLAQGQVDKVLTALASKSHGAFASVLRIPNYNNAEEEPDYWCLYGQALYAYSVRQAQGLAPFNKEVPDSVLQDFLARRARNHALNQWLQQQQAPGLSTLVFCQDDTGPVGLNVTEAQALQAGFNTPTTETIPNESNPHRHGLVQTGADEVAACMMVRLALAHHRMTPRVAVVYGDPTTQHAVMPFDGLPLATVVANKLTLCGAQLVPLAKQQHDEQPDVVWVIHAAHQTGDHMEHRPAEDQQTSLVGVQAAINDCGTLPVIVTDVAYANGGDPLLTPWLLAQAHRLYGYAGWNTPGNALGCGLAMGLARWQAEQVQRFNGAAFAQALATRLLDDGVYQGIIRPQGQRQNQTLNVTWLNAQLAPFLAQLATLTEGVVPVAHWPCQRWFELALTWP